MYKQKTRLPEAKIDVLASTDTSLTEYTIYTNNALSRQGKKPCDRQYFAKIRYLLIYLLYFALMHILYRT